MKTVTVEVTRRDIVNGRRRSCRHCPIALALGRLMATDNVFVGDTRAGVGETDLLFDLPEEAVRFIRDFDACEPVSPFTFTLDLPDELVRVA